MKRSVRDKFSAWEYDEYLKSLGEYKEPKSMKEFCIFQAVIKSIKQKEGSS